MAGNKRIADLNELGFAQFGDYVPMWRDGVVYKILGSNLATGEYSFTGDQKLSNITVIKTGTFQDSIRVSGSIVNSGDYLGGGHIFSYGNLGVYGTAFFDRGVELFGGFTGYGDIIFQNGQRVLGGQIVVGGITGSNNPVIFSGNMGISGHSIFNAGVQAKNFTGIGPSRFLGFTEFTGGIAVTGGFRLANTLTPPALIGSAGTRGDITWNSSYLFVCIANNAWRRIPLSEW